MTPELAAAIPPHLARFKAALTAQQSDRVYLNFAESPTDVSRAFDADAFTALQAVKAKYDPRDVFRHPQSIRLP
jgi:hypothetical protein